MLKGCLVVVVVLTNNWSEKQQLLTTVDTVFRKLVKAICTIDNETINRLFDNETRLSLAVSLANLPKVWFSFGGKN